MRAARSLTSSIARSSQSRPIVARRFLQSSSRALASEAPKDPFQDPAFKAFQEKVKNHEGAINAITTLGEVMKQKGFDTSKQPSMTQMAKMAMDSDLRNAAQTLMSELQKAGVDPKEAMEMFQKANSGQV
ncbi:uncharacterized protein I303_102804 [Kwoniella dejecticola CBS 10117]|uniref:Uncharacterized protein n=1 Tax=Kwoniella dejecticola CBS 10117 TaxID=1296121 RepID=A0A1A6A9R8_9TREE|nr:uncharacterized protein I303_02819 [Kwoniella dejecticola CBS 10117]OBR86804.1 hypothetical protein I303_02819 [Kwoniella dejecticola CBS 10117]